jgi:hypothetical protein
MPPRIVTRSVVLLLPMEAQPDEPMSTEFMLPPAKAANFPVSRVQIERILATAHHHIGDTVIKLHRSCHASAVGKSPRRRQ